MEKVSFSIKVPFILSVIINATCWNIMVKLTVWGLLYGWEQISRAVIVIEAELWVQAYKVSLYCFHYTVSFLYVWHIPCSMVFFN